MEKVAQFGQSPRLWFWLLWVQVPFFSHIIQGGRERKEICCCFHSLARVVIVYRYFEGYTRFNLDKKIAGSSPARPTKSRSVSSGQLARLITWRSVVRIHPSQQINYLLNELWILNTEVTVGRKEKLLTNL